MIEQKTIEWIKNNQTVCLSPYSRLDLRIHDQQLAVTCCCNLDVDTNVALDFAQIEQIGKEMAVGVKPAECKICWDIEDHGGQSERIKYLVSFPNEKLEEFVQTRQPDEFTIGAKFSNKCNLACRSCNELDSSFWATTMGIPQDPLYTEDISNNPIFWTNFTNKILEHIGKHKQLSVQPIGGETLLTNGFNKLIHWILDQNIADQITLKLTTSLAANISNEIWQAFAQFKKVILLASVDSVGDNYHCVRWPAKFSKVESNLLEIVRRNQNQKFDLYLTPVFSLNNIFYAEDYLNWWEAWADNTQQKLFLQSTYLYKPVELMVEVLPHRYWPHLKDMLGRCVNHNIFKKHSTDNALWSYFNNLMSAQSINNDVLWNNYLKFSAEYDSRTNTNILTLNSKLFDLLTQEDISKINHFKTTQIRKI